MSERSPFDYATPYELMVGVWYGMTTTFDDKGNYVGSNASRVVVYWDEPGVLLRYKQEEVGDLDRVLGKTHSHHAALTQIYNHDFDLRINGKACVSERNPEGMKCVGAETTPGVYLFHLKFPQGQYYNNQYFSTPNERHIIGPYIPGRGHAFGMVVSQTFSRVSYDVPKELRKFR